MYLEVVPGCLVLESGTGSGSLTTLFARAVAPTGHVYTFDFHEQRAASAREDFKRDWNKHFSHNGSPRYSGLKHVETRWNSVFLLTVHGTSATFM
ncbi:hypothetical protein V6Z11_A06G000100 [Gossypium hirsutum]